MPVTSSKQYGFMGAVASGRAKTEHRGLTPEKAKEFLAATPEKKRRQFAKAQSRKRMHKALGGY
jgi:hypothetical protein